MIRFNDFNFKLAIIDELMYVQKVLLPQFDIYKFAETYDKRKIDIDKEGYQIISEAKEYFENLDIPEEFFNLITRISQDGGNETYMNIIPFWDGEDDVFNIKSVDDSKYFPNLKMVTLFYSKDNTILNQLRNLGIDADYL